MSQFYSSSSSQQQMGLMPLNPNAFSGNTMNLSPIMPGTPHTTSCPGSFSGNDFDAAATTAQQQQQNTSGNSAVDSSMASTASTKSTKRKYTHNPYARTASQTGSSSRSASSNASEANNSAPPTPNATSFNAPSPFYPPQQQGDYANQIQAMAAAGAYGGAPNAMMLEQFMLPTSQVSGGGNNTNSSNINNMNMNMGYNSNNSNSNNHHHHQRRGSNNHHYNNNGSNNNNHHQSMMPAHQMSSSSSLTSSTSSNSGMGAAAPTAAATDAAIVTYGNGAVHSLKNATEQFDAMRGQLAASSCSMRGRHVVIAMIRLQQPEYTDILFSELVPAWDQLIGDMNGCHVARTFVECIPSARVTELCAALSRDTILAMCACSQHSRRVLQAMFENHRADLLQPIVEHVVTGCVGLATTQQGCISVMRVLELSTPTQRESIMTVLSPHLAALAMDPYGNYVVQTIIQSFTREDACSTLEKSFDGNWVPLSCNKFASNVVEKLIRISTASLRKVIVEELCLNQQNLSMIIVDGYGNFVLQAIIDSCSNAGEFKKISERVKPLLASSPYGHKIEGKLKSKRFNNSNNSSAQQTPTLTAAAAPVQ